MSGTNHNPPPPAAGGVQRQIRLPLSKAVEIAYKSIRLRLSRSLLVTSGIILALAFLMSIQAGDAIMNGMRQWIATAPKSDAFVDLQKQRQSLEQSVLSSAAQVREAVRTAPKPDSKMAKFDPKQVFKTDFPGLQKELGPLPATSDDLISAITTRPATLDTVKQWVDASRQLRDVKDQLTGPEQLAAMMQANGVPTTPEEIETNRVQTLWLLGLALLVAFVGILNAMLMSVTERFREIGTMKCLGALDSFIIKLFLIESLFQGMVGTIAGILLGLLLSIASTTSSYGSFTWKMFPMTGVLAAAGFCLVVGVGLTVAGACYPAWQAARMQPIEAMRVEA